jgi:hypothetical protein
MFANFRPEPRVPEGARKQPLAVQRRAPDPRRAVEHYARAAADIGRITFRTEVREHIPYPQDLLQQWETP